MSPGVHAKSCKPPFALQPVVLVCTPQLGSFADGVVAGVAVVSPVVAVAPGGSTVMFVVQPLKTTDTAMNSTSQDTYFLNELPSHDSDTYFLLPP
jgi:hypothetical protein